LINYTKHIGLLLLILFTGSFIAEPVTAAYNLNYTTPVNEQSGDRAFDCLSGFLVPNDAKPSSTSGDRTIDSTPEDQKNSQNIVKICHSGLQLLPVANQEVNRPENTVSYSDFIHLLSSQLFVNRTADPPQFG